MLEQTDITIIGAGLMGCGIAHVFASQGAPVALYEPSARARDAALGRIRESLEAVGLPTERVDDALARITLHDVLAAAVADAQWVFEAAPEDLALKRDLFERLDRLAPIDAILATNTSVMRVAQIGALAGRPERVIGTHWWNPPYLVPLVEVVGTTETDEPVVARALALLREVGKHPVRVRKDIPGFIGNRLQHALWRQAFALVDAGVCEPEDIDAVIKASFGPRLTVLGPMENADLIGLDLTKQIHDYILPTLDPPSAVSDRLSSLVADGQLGFKTGGGFRPWTDDDAAATRQRLVQHLTGSRPGQPSTLGDS